MIEGFEKYIDINIRKYKTKCCNAPFYYIVGKEDVIKCSKCDSDVTKEITSVCENLKIDFERKLKQYQSGFDL